MCERPGSGIWRTRTSDGQRDRVGDSMFVNILVVLANDLHLWSALLHSSCSKRHQHSRDHPGWMLKEAPDDHVTLPGHVMTWSSCYRSSRIWCMAALSNYCCLMVQRGHLSSHLQTRMVVRCHLSPMLKQQSKGRRDDAAFSRSVLTRIRRD